MSHLTLAEGQRRMIALPLLIALCALMVLLAAGQARAATLTVTNTNDSGAGSLRQAIIDANTAPGTDEIDFAIPGAGIHSITLASPLPLITNGIFIDGYTQPGSQAATVSSPASIMIDLNGNGGAGSGLEFSTGSDISRVRGLAIHNFVQNGVAMDFGVSGVQVDGNLIGIDASGNNSSNGASGIYANAANNTTVGGTQYANRNVISNHNSAGVMISGGSSSVISGNFIGTDPAGTSSAANIFGIYLDGTDGVAVGGTTAPQQNIVSGNTNTGIELNGATNTTISGNYIGLDVTGVGALGNGLGIHTQGQAINNTIGGNSAAQRNLISGNTSRGVLIESNNNNVYGNLIGLDVSGEVARPNGTNGVELYGEVGNNNIGGPLAGQGNVISGNGGDGVVMNGAFDNVVQCNLVGLNAYGSGACPNTYAGVLIISGGRNKVGGSNFKKVGSKLETVSGGLGNVVSGNGTYGVQIDTSNDSIVQGNLIGTDFGGAEPQPNLGAGVYLNAANNTTIGGAGSAGNVIAGNGVSGISMASSTDCTVQGNLIGVSTNQSPLPNGGHGMLLYSGSDRAVIGGAQETGNQISNNSQCGIDIVQTTDVSITFNAIWRNGMNGVAVSDNASFRDEISMNSIYGNGWLGISFGGTNTPTPNDGNNNNPNKPNLGFNYPVFSATTFPVVGGTVHVMGTAPANSVVEVFKTGSPPDPSGHGQGQVVLVSIPVGASGTFSADLTGLAAGDSICATATSTAQAPAGAGNTSEFSGNALITEKTKPEVTGVNPPTGQEGQKVTVTGSAFGATQGSSTITIGGLPADVVSWSDTKIVVTVPPGASSGAVIVTTSQGGSNDNKIFTLVYPTWYLAEGTTAWGFSTYITIENPNTTAVTAKITYMDPTPASGKGRVFPPRTITLPAMSQTTVDPHWDLGNTDFSTKIQCLQGKTIAVDRTMSWTGAGAPSPEGHNSVGTSSPAKTWYLPEGSSAWNFETWTLIENPGSTDAHVALTYMVEGQGAKVINKTVPAFSRATYSMAQDLGTQADASVKVSSDTAVIAEQSMYRNNRREGSCSIGANTPSTDYFLAEGTTAWGFTTYVLVQNPNPTPTDVTITCMTPTGPVALPSFRMDPNSRETTLINHWLPDTDLSIQVHGTQPIIAERSMFWGEGTALGEACHASVGLEGPHMTFLLPDGQTSNGYETFTCVQNPNPGSVRVQVSYLPQGGGKTITFTDEIPKGSRKTYNMGDKVPSGRASVIVKSLDGARPIMVERSMYWNNRGAGTNTVGVYSN